MNGHAFTLAGAALVALPSGALWWPDERLLCVSDLHLCKAERVARRSGRMLPPYETADTLARLDAALAVTGAETVLCLGDSFDDLAAAAALGAADAATLAALQAGRRWVWVEGNHDPGQLALPGVRAGEVRFGPLVFRHIAAACLGAEPGEVSGHYHPKAALGLGGARVSRPCFLYDARRAVLPAFGTYTGGLSWTSPALRALFPGPVSAVLTGRSAHMVPVPHAAVRPARSPAPRRLPR